MDINDLRGLATVTTMIAFIGIVIWAYSRKRKSRFDEAAHLPFDDEEMHRKSSPTQEKKNDE